MTNFDVLEHEQTSWTDSNPDLNHVVCYCNDDWALCGEDVSNDPWAYGPTPDDCFICAHATKCNLCGDEFEPEVQW